MYRITVRALWIKGQTRTDSASMKPDGGEALLVGAT